MTKRGESDSERETVRERDGANRNRETERANGAWLLVFDVDQCCIHRFCRASVCVCVCVCYSCV